MVFIFLHFYVNLSVTLETMISNREFYRYSAVYVIYIAYNLFC